MKLLFEWDDRKGRSNLRKHGVGFEEAKTVFGDPQLVTFPDADHSEEEERHIGMGTSAQSRVLLVVHTETEMTGETMTIRLISCRKATRLERGVYERGGR